MPKLVSPDILAAIHLCLSSTAFADHSVYVVGGLIRDTLLGQGLAVKDIDLVVEGDAQDIISQLSSVEVCRVKSYQRTKTASFHWRAVAEVGCDLVSARAEVYPTPGSFPVVSLASLSEDLLRRDFTINSFALPLRDCYPWLMGTTNCPILIDPCNGKLDLNNRLVKVLHNQSFLDDPTRIIRALRYQSKIDGCLDPLTDSLMQEAVSRGALSFVSVARVTRELLRVFDSSDWLASYWSSLQLSGCLETWRGVINSQILFDNLGKLQEACIRSQGDRSLLGLSLILRIFDEPEKVLSSLNLSRVLRRLLSSDLQSGEVLSHAFTAQVDSLESQIHE